MAYWSKWEFVGRSKNYWYLTSSSKITVINKCVNEWNGEIVSHIFWRSYEKKWELKSLKLMRVYTTFIYILFFSLNFLVKNFLSFSLSFYLFGGELINYIFKVGVYFVELIRSLGGVSITLKIAVKKYAKINKKKGKK